MNESKVQNQEPGMLAAILCSRNEHADDILDGLVKQLQAEGRRVVGYLQRSVADGQTCCSAIRLESIASGEEFLISQPLGADARGCRLDSQALAACVPPLLQQIEAGADLLVTNRFGIGESEGHGFRPVMETAFLHGIPLLTVIRPNYLEHWQAFGGEFATTLPADADTVLTWCRTAIAVKGEALAAVI